MLRYTQSCADCRVGAYGRRKDIIAVYATSVFADNGDIVSGVVNRKPELDRLARALLARAVTDIRGFSQGLRQMRASRPLLLSIRLLSSDGLLKPRVLGKSIIAGATLGHRSIASVFNASASCQPPWHDDYLARDPTLSGQRIVRRDFECRGADTRPIVGSVIYFGAHIEQFRQDEPRLDAEEPFLNLSRDEKIAQLSVSFEPARNHMTLSRGGRQVVSGNTEMPVGRLMLDQFFAGFTPAGGRGNPKLVEAGDLNLRRRTGNPYVSISAPRA